MANTVYNKIDIALQDGTDVELYPLPINQLRRFMKVWATVENIKSEDADSLDVLDIYIDLAGISLENQLNGSEDLKDKFVKTRGTGDKTLDTKYKDYLESVLDSETIFKILDICGGLKLNDPKFMEAVAQAAANAAASPGTI